MNKKKDIIKVVKESVNRIRLQEQTTDKIYTDFDSTWNYRVSNNEWQAAKKVAPDKWYDLKNIKDYALAKDRLDSRYPGARDTSMDNTVTKVAPAPGQSAPLGAQVSGIPTRNTPPDNEGNPAFTPSTGWNEKGATFDVPKDNENISQFLPFKDTKGAQVFLQTFRKYYPKTYAKNAQYAQPNIVLNPRKHKPEDVKNINDTFLLFNRKMIRYQGKEIPFGEYFKITNPQYSK